MGNGTTFDPGTHRQLAVDLFNRTWELLDKKARSDNENDEMLTAAFASLHHWRQIGDAKNRSVGNWQVSRVAAVLGYPELAEDYGRRSLEVASASDLGPFYVAYGHEALARAARLAGNRKDVARHLALATEMLEQTTDSAERTSLTGDLAELGPE
jgi:hypothetical protein